MRYCVDIDGTICSPTVGRAYEKAEPWKQRIDKLNKLYDEGHPDPTLHGGKYPGNVGLMDWNENEWFDY